MTEILLVKKNLAANQRCPPFRMSSNYRFYCIIILSCWFFSMIFTTTECSTMTSRVCWEVTIAHLTITKWMIWHRTLDVVKVSLYDKGYLVFVKGIALWVFLFHLARLLHCFHIFHIFAILISAVCHPKNCSKIFSRTAFPPLVKGIRKIVSMQCVHKKLSHLMEFIIIETYT